MALLDENGRPMAKTAIATDLLERLQGLAPYTQNAAEVDALHRLRQMAYQKLNDAGWLRRTFRQRGSHSDLMRLSSQLWMTDTVPVT
jgi:carboxylate-amine ligase